jgi:hypothetical protein
VTGTLRDAMAVAKYSPAAGGGLEVHFLDHGNGVRAATMTGVDSPLAAGTHEVRFTEREETTPLRLAITPRGKVYAGAGTDTFGPFDWGIEQRAGVLDLTWDMAGQRVIDGFGFADPHSSRSIIVVYWGARTG